MAHHMRNTATKHETQFSVECTAPSDIVYLIIYKVAQ